MSYPHSLEWIGYSADPTIPAEQATTNLPPFEHYLAVGYERGIALTDLRQRVFRLLWRDGAPWGPYRLAKEMRTTGSRVYPNSLYRILGALEQAGLIVSLVTPRRVQIVPDPANSGWAALQCQDCKRHELVPSKYADPLRKIADRLGFVVEQVVIECSGRCQSCHSAMPASGPIAVNVEPETSGAPTEGRGMTRSWHRAGRAVQHIATKMGAF